MSPNLFKLEWMKDPYRYMNFPEYGFPHWPYSPARPISKIGRYWDSKIYNSPVGLSFNVRSNSFDEETCLTLKICPSTKKFNFSKVCLKKFFKDLFSNCLLPTIFTVPYFFPFYSLKC